MRKIIPFKMFKFFNKPFSVFAKIPDLSLYNLEELSKIARKMNKKIWEEDNYIYVEWSDARTCIQIKFNPNGTYNKLIMEEWKDFNMIINHEKINITSD